MVAEPALLKLMTNNKKPDPSTLFSDSISLFTKSATKAFNDFQNQVRAEVARAEADTRQVQSERDQALKALQESKKETQRYKDEILECKASLKEAELTNKHHVQNYALLQREANQWKDQTKNWQEHFLRVEQERCSLSSRMDELVAERLIIPPVTPKLSVSKPTASSITHSSAPRPPTYRSAGPASSSNEAGSSQSPLSTTQPVTRSTATGRSATKRKVPSQSELPPYTEVAHTPQITKPSTSAPTSAVRSSRKPPAAAAVVPSTRVKKPKPGPTPAAAPPPPAASPEEPSQERQERQTIFIRRVRAVVEVKQEEESDEDLSEPSPPESPEESASTSRRSRNVRRARQIVDDDDDYLPEDVSPEFGSNEDAEDDELMIGAGDDLSFDVGRSSSSRQASKPSPSKKRKLNTSTRFKSNAKRKS